MILKLAKVVWACFMNSLEGVKKIELRELRNHKYALKISVKVAQKLSDDVRVWVSCLSDEAH